MDAATVVLLVILALGGLRGWRNISQGSGIIGRLMPESSYHWVNQSSIGSIAVKLGISVGFAYIFAAFAILSLVLGFLFGMSRMKF